MKAVTILQPWASGPWCWILGDLRPLPKPIPCKGARGLWDLTDESVLLRLRDV